jgi:hypothetical protein
MISGQFSEDLAIETADNPTAVRAEQLHAPAEVRSSRLNRETVFEWMPAPNLILGPLLEPDCLSDLVLKLI